MHVRSCACLITMLIVASCAGVGCFQCPLFGLPDRTLLSGRAREGERPLNNVLIVSFSQHSPLCSGYRDSCLIYSPKGTAGDHAAFVWPHRRFPSPRCGCKTCALTCMPFSFAHSTRAGSPLRYDLKGKSLLFYLLSLLKEMVKNPKFPFHVSGCTFEAFRCFRQMGFAMIMSWITGVYKYQEELNAPFCIGA